VRRSPALSNAGHIVTGFYVFERNDRKIGA
jgi:hypothetical protein